MNVLNSLKSSVLSTTGVYTLPTIVKICRQATLYTLKGIQNGTLSIEDVDGTKYEFGQGNGAKPHSQLKILEEVFWIRLVLGADMGFAESYMLNQVSTPDLVPFFQIFIQNRSNLSDGTTIFSSITTAITTLFRSTNTLSNARLNIAAHYDISNSMFAAFLSSDMTYSCAIWSPDASKNGGQIDTKLTPPATPELLETAQLRKLRHVISQARIKSTDHVLEIGTGWGSFAIEAVRQTGCRVTSLTLSVEQKALAEKRIRAEGFENKIFVLLCDYRAMPITSEPFDKVVSIEMAEAVGQEYMETYFRTISALLKPEGGIAVIQCITMPETRHDAYAKGDDFIRKYIFPGGYLPSVTSLTNAIKTGSKDTLMIDAITNIGGHYARTLRLWRENFLNNFDARIAPALKKEKGEIFTDEEILIFKRKWEYYFTYCEAGFNSKVLGDVIITMGREGAMELLEGIPL